MENKIIEEQIFINGDVEQVKKLLNEGWVIPMSYIKRDSSPLIAAINFGNCNVDMVDFLLGQNVDINCIDGFGYNALLYATLGSNVDIIEKLLDKGARLPEKSREEIFYTLIRDQKIDIIDRLVAHGQFNCNSIWDEKTLLMHAVEKGDLNMVQYLVDLGADINNNIECDYKSSPLALAIENDHEDIVEYLLSIEGIDINIPFGTRYIYCFATKEIEKDYICLSIVEYVKLGHYGSRITNLFSKLKSK